MNYDIYKMMRNGKTERTRIKAVTLTEAVKTANMSFLRTDCVYLILTEENSTDVLQSYERGFPDNVPTQRHRACFGHHINIILN